MLQKAQLGRNIMQGAISLWSTVEFIHQRNKMGFMVKLDFYHAYDRVCWPYEDWVPAAMAFSDTYVPEGGAHPAQMCRCFFSHQQNHNISAFHLLSLTGGLHYHVVVQQLGFSHFCSAWRMFYLVSTSGF